VSVKYRTTMKYMSHCFNLCNGVWLDSHSFHLYPYPAFAHLFRFLYCPVMCLYVLNSVLWYRLRLPYKNDIRFVFTSSYLLKGTCLICVCLRIVVSNTNCVCLVCCVYSCSGLSILDCLFGFSSVY